MSKIVAMNTERQVTHLMNIIKDTYPQDGKKATEMLRDELDKLTDEQKLYIISYMIGALIGYEQVLEEITR